MMDFSGIKELTIGGVKLKELSVDGVKLWQSGRLPAGYTELEYIEATGTQYIDTGITAHSGVDVEMSIMILSPVKSTGTAILSSTDGSVRAYIEANYMSPSFRWMFGANTTYNANNTLWEFDTRYKFSIEWGTSQSEIYVDGVRHMTLKHGTFDNGCNMYLFARNTSGTASKIGNARVYYLKMWDSGTLARDLVPAKYKDGAVGLYDLVTNTFFTNAGTGEFIAGGAV